MKNFLGLMKGRTFGIILILIGIIASLEKYFSIEIDFSKIWPIILLFLGFVFLFKKEKKSDD